MLAVLAVIAGGGIRFDPRERRTREQADASDQRRLTRQLNSTANRLWSTRLTRLGRTPSPAPETELNGRSRARAPGGPTRTPGFEILARPDRESVYLELVGELDLASASELHPEVERLIDAGFAHLVLDLRRLTFIDSSGLRCLLALTAVAQGDDWRLSLIQGPTALRKLFTLTGTLDLLPFVTPDELPD